ncbi:ADP-ribose pyrophosphatase, mitochondrial-like isoform X2 [Mytilus californianus]|uniref:ADP-ribose pyrophosphatase, mitochondrial-like isoform X2 n=1 Tax=Mytilus californianus TaxID=6549 RepID=UPI002245ED7A|nr:ADP-ribose pyrophosphatase, mitochondrial-like isoform X2 [Mytilus californianus]
MTNCLPCSQGVLWLSVSIVVLSVFALVVDVYLNGNHMTGFSNGVRRLSFKIGQTKPSKMKFGGPHCKARCEVYPRTKDVKRFKVPDDKVPWKVPFPEYSPPSFTTETVLSGPYYADPDICSGKGEITKWNEIDGRVSRVSFEGKYEVVEGLPLNPVGRTGLKHRGCLGRWGPNHAADPIVTRWKRTDDDQIVKGEDGKPIMQFVSVQRRDNGEWAIPGGKVDAGEVVTDTVLREFGEEALSTKEISQEEKYKAVESMKQFFTKGIEVYEGYVDDPRNTDNAWMETTAYHFHDHDGTKVGQFNLHAGDDAMAVQWMDCNSAINLYASHKSFLQEAAKRIDASW